ncbi:MAG: hypothetical protein H7839_07155 [Magnetococcus sp. YQC-5]
MMNADHYGKLFQKWFIEYNPLYFFSSGCMLAGIFAFSNSLTEQADIDPITGVTLLFLVIQIYEFLLLGGAWLLFRRTPEKRPGIILGLLALFFLFDPTFRVETFSLHGEIGLGLAAVWMLLIVVKVEMMARIFLVRLAVTLWIGVGLATAGIILLPHLGGLHQLANHVAMMCMAWIGFLIFIIPGRKTPALISLVPLEGWANTVHKRIDLVVRTGLGGFYYYHLLNHLAWIAPDSSENFQAQVLPFLFWYCILAKDPQTLIKRAFFPLFIIIDLIWLSPTALLLAMLFLWRAMQQTFPFWRTVLLSIAVVLVYVAYWLLGWKFGMPIPKLPAMISVPNALAALAFGGILWKWNRKLFVLTAVLGVIGYVPWSQLMPSSSLGRSLLLLGVGFTTLVSGIAINWHYRRQSDAADKKKDENQIAN